jgi:hypothetical protein
MEEFVDAPPCPTAAPLDAVGLRQASRSQDCAGSTCERLEIWRHAARDGSAVHAAQMKKIPAITTIAP